MSTDEIMTNTSPQWGAFANQHAVIHAFESVPREALETLMGLPEVIDNEAPRTYALRSLEQLQRVIDWATWCRRIVVDRNLQIYQDSRLGPKSKLRDSITRREISAVTGMSAATIQKLSHDPLMTVPEHIGASDEKVTRSGRVGPATLHEE